jgi:sigma-B regulation protein RsbU (phosphoserine phosphatase)
LSDDSLEEDLLDLFENAPCGYVSITPEGLIAKVNLTLADWLGRPPAELLSTRFRELLSFGGRIAFETHLAPMLRLQGRVDEIALDLLSASKVKIPVIANAAEKRGPDGSHQFTRITLFKALDRRRYERTLVDAREKAEQEVLVEHEIAHLREQFIAVLGHDLRNPLAAIAAGVRLLDNEALSERGRMVVREMGRSMERGNLLIDDVLDFARGRLGEGLILSRDDKEPLTPVLEQVVAEVRAIVPDRTIETNFAIREPVHCDRQRLGQLAANLVSNAVAHGAPDLPIVVEARSIGDTFVLSVVSGGSPISPKARAKLFQPFFRGDVRQSQQGLGLGLFIVNEIAKAHGGEMSVVSDETETRFTFAMDQSPG